MLANQELVELQLNEELKSLIESLSLSEKIGLHLALKELRGPDVSEAVEKILRG